ncbi:hypothetical protein MBRA1_002435 [Malassezia brasiliensis]|uniref:Acylphosphatase n=1 Tax=Malassezia brasiliensis TaxID=1821822 RepID=A0AAF0DU51_9BASI|nr:hypothetical protein MBRA1_002435 [Malassezia brasiliensis]
MSSYIYFRVTGTVQGVSFRQSTVQQANALGLRGWVRNEPDGSVSGEAAGATEHIQKLRDYLHHGPQQARVDNVDIMFIKNHDLSQSTLPVPFELRA